MAATAFPATGAVPDTAQTATSPVMGWAAVVALCLAQVVSTIDRGMLALVVDPVRADLGITEVQIALLQGFAFAVFYVSVGLPLGYLADKVNRRALLVTGILVWSAATLGSGFARGFGDLFLARLLVGMGEAVLAPCAVGMISEMFPPERRGRPMSVYVLGTMVAFGIGAAVCGMILGAAPKGAFAAWPVVGSLAPWRVAFVLVGLSGVPVALMLAWLGGAGGRGKGVAAAGGGREALGALKARARVLLPLYGSIALFAMGGAASTNWSAVMLTRGFGVTVAVAGKALGGALIVWALIGAALAAWLVDRVAARSGTSGKIALSGAVTLAMIPSCFGFLAPGFTGAVAMSAEVMGASALFGTIMLSVIAEIVPPGTRGLAVALYAFVMTMIGGSLGPLAVAWLTEHLFHDPRMVGWSMGIVGGTALVVGAVLALTASRRWAAWQGDRAPA